LDQKDEADKYEQLERDKRALEVALREVRAEVRSHFGPSRTEKKEDQIRKILSGIFEEKD
jgi:hypothetical protein